MKEEKQKIVLAAFLYLPTFHPFPPIKPKLQSNNTISTLVAAHISFIALHFPAFAITICYFSPRPQSFALSLLLSSFLAAIDDLGQLPVRRLFDYGRPAHHLLAQGLASEYDVKEKRALEKEGIY